MPTILCPVLWSSHSLSRAWARGRAPVASWPLCGAPREISSQPQPLLQKLFCHPGDDGLIPGRRDRGKGGEWKVSLAAMTVQRICSVCRRCWRHGGILRRERGIKRERESFFLSVFLPSPFFFFFPPPLLVGENSTGRIERKGRRSRHMCGRKKEREKGPSPSSSPFPFCS